MAPTHPRRSYYFHRHLWRNLLHADWLPCFARLSCSGLVRHSLRANEKTACSYTDRNLRYVLALRLRAVGSALRACLPQLTHLLYWEIDRAITAQHNQSVTRIIRLILCIILLLWLIPPFAAAQGCAMCQTVMPQAGEPIARGMFWCVLLLLTAPFAVCAIVGGWLAYQYRRARRSQNVSTPAITLHPANSQG